MPGNESGPMKPSSREFYFDAAVAGMVGVAELTWYGIDGEGCLAALSTAGGGPIPRAAVADKALYYRMDDLFAELQPSSSAEIVRGETSDVSTWEDETDVAFTHSITTGSESATTG
jgi:hypothetical protein